MFDKLIFKEKSDKKLLAEIERETELTEGEEL